VFYIEDTGECVYDPVQNTRATDPTYGTTYIHNALEPHGLGDDGRSFNYDGSYHGRSLEDVRRYARRRRSLHQPLRRLLVLARRICTNPEESVRRFGSGLHAAGDREGRAVVREFFQRFDRLFTFGANIGTAGLAIPTVRSHGTRRGSRLPSTTGSLRRCRAIGSRP